MRIDLGSCRNSLLMTSLRRLLVSFNNPLLCGQHAYGNAQRELSLQEKSALCKSISVRLLVPSGIITSRRRDRPGPSAWSVWVLSGGSQGERSRARLLRPKAGLTGHRSGLRALVSLLCARIRLSKLSWEARACKQASSSLPGSTLGKSIAGNPREFKSHGTASIYLKILLLVKC